MCGIAGIISRSDQSEKAQKFKTLLNHRGPDASAVSTVQLSQFQVNFTHNRLSIIDLQVASNQPFWDESDQYGIIFNGEIYNYLEIRRELESEGREFRTQSDTEVLLQALMHWPLERVLGCLNGMWAFAYLDKRAEKILVCRDRFGKKPFYYHLQDNEFYWASEIKYILEASEKKFRPNPQTVARYLRQFLLESDGTQTFFEDILKLPAGSFAWLDLKASRLDIKPEQYYHIPAKNFAGDFKEAREELQHLLRDSVKIRLRSDVNLGFLLSGGLDSSILSGLGHQLSENSGQNLNYLSVVSEDPRYDESPHIREVEKFLGIHSHKINIAHNSNEIFDLLSKAQWQNDEPITSFSAVSYMMMMEKAKALNTKVLLTGQGADEIFCGYKKYLGFYLKDLVRQGHGFKALKTGLEFLMTRSLVTEVHLGELKRYVKFLNQGQIQILSSRLAQIEQPSIGLGNQGVRGRQIADLLQFSVPALLHYEDRLSMAHAREVRAPYLDYRIVELGLSLPMEHKLNHGWSKYILRKAARGIAPESIAWRKDKRGFTIPQETWFKRELRPQIEKIFDGPALMYEMGFVDKESLLRKYKLFCSDAPSAKLISFKEIFVPLALENWLRVFERHWE